MICITKLKYIFVFIAKLPSIIFDDLTCSHENDLFTKSKVNIFQLHRFDDGCMDVSVRVLLVFPCAIKVRHKFCQFDLEEIRKSYIDYLTLWFGVISHFVCSNHFERPFNPFVSGIYLKHVSPTFSAFPSLHPNIMAVIENSRQFNRLFFYYISIRKQKIIVMYGCFTVRTEYFITVEIGSNKKSNKFQIK